MTPYEKLVKLQGKSVAGLALKNTPQCMIDTKFWYDKDRTLSTALSGAFTWSTSPQGREFWDVINCQAIRAEL